MQDVIDMNRAGPLFYKSRDGCLAQSLNSCCSYTYAYAWWSTYAHVYAMVYAGASGYVYVYAYAHLAPHEGHTIMGQAVMPHTTRGGLVCMCGTQLWWYGAMVLWSRQTHTGVMGARNLKTGE